MNERHLTRLLAPLGYPDRAPLPPGDDAGGVYHGGRALLLKTDGFRARDVRMRGMPEAALGWRAVMAVASDLLAKLAEPLGFVLAVFAEQVEAPLAWGEGAARAARALGTPLLGGDTNRGEAALAAAGMGVSAAPLPRAARPGDRVYLVGDRWGRSGAAIDAHYRALDLSAFPAIREAGYWPRARRALLALAPLRGFLRGSADSSDGLVETLYQLAEAGGVGIELFSIPLFADVLAYANEAGVDPERLVLFGGEEYEAVLAVEPEGAPFVEGLLSSLGVPLFRVGRVVEGTGVTLRGERLLRAGYDHFAR